jgi:hypothetical protein
MDRSTAPASPCPCCAGEPFADCYLGCWTCGECGTSNRAGLHCQGDPADHDLELAEIMASLRGPRHEPEVFDRLHPPGSDPEIPF